MAAFWEDTKTATVGTDGTAVVTLQVTTRPSWAGVRITGVSVALTSGRTSTARAYLTRDTVDGRPIGSSGQGGSSSSIGSTYVPQGNSIVCRWEGARPGETATLHAEGEFVAP